MTTTRRRVVRWHWIQNLVQIGYSRFYYSQVLHSYELNLFHSEDIYNISEGQCLDLMGCTAIGHLRDAH